MAVLIPVKGEPRIVRPKDPKAGFSPEELREFVGGWLEVVIVEQKERGHAVALIIDEEGLRKDKPVNPAPPPLTS